MRNYANEAVEALIGQTCFRKLLQPASQSDEGRPGGSSADQSGAGRDSSSLNVGLELLLRLAKKQASSCSRLYLSLDSVFFSLCSCRC